MGYKRGFEFDYESQTAMFGSPEELMGGLFITWFAVTAENSHHIPNPSLWAVWGCVRPHTRMCSLNAN